jgi:hypothetical protein
MKTIFELESHKDIIPSSEYKGEKNIECINIKDITDDCNLLDLIVKP